MAPGGVDDDRRAAIRGLLDTIVTRLVTRAATEHWPIRADHCFLRIAYDAAADGKWDTLYARPAWRSLPLDRLGAAVDVLGAIERDGLPALVRLNAASLTVRRAARAGHALGK
ncbi:hypothetical protein KZX46_14660 [Polymorphobacter sp. PAMC 29334]|uniref:hypothetical protein n=1 Tax=Polymorphobacter sp. PAMC 29334 TaxID=2862331 RepID=UPI001C76D5EF|nr:hypothetical protein [Polymorphobacter sp. PAMC 29334]QYE34042.1 hypothetical protein KZX46_14660 [Polymorphobacter sp. PAMC 29334]